MGDSHGYTAHLIVTDFTGAPQDLFFIVLTWLHAACPPAKPDALKFHVDIIDHEKADVSLAVDLAEAVRVKEGDTGHTLTGATSGDALAFDMKTFYPTLPDTPPPDALVGVAGEVREGRPCPLSLWRTDARRNPLRFGLVISVKIPYGNKKAALGAAGVGKIGVPNRIRTGVAAVRGRCPRPLDDGDAKPMPHLRKSGRGIKRIRACS